MFFRVDSRVSRSKKKLVFRGLEEVDEDNMNDELILYKSDDGQSEVQLRAEAGSAWLTQLEQKNDKHHE